MSTLGLALLTAWALAPEPRSVSLLPTRFEGELEPHWQQQIGERIGEGFSQGDFRLVSGDALGPDASACAEPKCFASIAERSGSDLVVVSSVRVVEKDFTVSLRVVDGDDGATLASAEDTCALCGAQEAADMAKDLAATLRGKLDALAKAKPSIVVSSDPPGAKVRIDGKVVGVTPVQLEIAEGEHAIELERRGYVTETRTLEAVAGVRDRLSVTLTPGERAQRKGAWVAGWVTFGAGLAGVAAGTTLLVLDERPYRADCRADADGDCLNLYDTQTAGIVAMAVGGVALVTGIALVAVGRPTSKRNQKARVTPTAGGLAVRF